MTVRRPGSWFRLTSHVSLLTLLAAPLLAQSPPDLAKERKDFTTWLATAPDSPLAAVAQQPIGTGLTLGPAEADIPLAGIAASRVTQESGAIYLVDPNGRRAFPRGQLVQLGNYRIRASGSSSRSVSTVFGPQNRKLVPAFYPDDPRFAFTGTIVRPSQRISHRILGLDGLEVEAVESGVFTVSLGSSVTALKVYRADDDETGESDLFIYFRDATSGKGSYPAGRFVSLLPAPDGRYLLDLNRSRNPFCAHSTASPCPLPWPGNSLPEAVTAGERY